MKKLVFIHGRAQQNKDSGALKNEWIEAWRKGLAKSSLDVPMEDENIRFPYYGQTLFELSSGVPSDRAADIVIKGIESDEAARAFIGQLVEEARRKAGISDAEIEQSLPARVVEKGPLNWPWVQAILQTMDKHPGLSGASVALATNDVYQYLNNQGFRDEIEEGVSEAIKPGVATVVVSHSLGTVVAYSVLKNKHYASGWKVPLFVTLGSPLGVSSIRGGFEPFESPACIGAWYNAMDERDVVALYPLKAPQFDMTPKITNKTDVNNHTDNRHGIAGYLDDKEVAKKIYDALMA